VKFGRPSLYASGIATCNELQVKASSKTWTTFDSGAVLLTFSFGLLPRKLLEPLNNHITISRVYFHEERSAARLLSPDQG